MRKLIELVLGLFSKAPPTPAESSCDDRFVPLDAEDLAEGGIKERYEELLPELRKYVSDQVEIEEELGEYSEFYIVRANGREYRIYDDPDDQRSWGHATFAFFEIVNENLAGASMNFYALYGGNDLGGMFLTAEEMEEVRRTTPNRYEWPYRPTMEDPWYGQFH
jgi:hypothetical protein